MKSRRSAGSAIVEQAAPLMQNLRQHLSDYLVHRVFNFDETALFFNFLPRRTYTLVNENIKRIRGSKYMQAKDRVTVYTCSNADGSNEILIAIIGSSNNPRCIKTQPGCKYMSSKTAWSNTYLFEVWITEVFKPNVECNQSNQVPLKVDNAISHRNLTMPEGIDNFPHPPQSNFCLSTDGSRGFPNMEDKL